ncbi:MAG: GYF domain-containing protein [Bdellovibrionia bacterium]
MSSKYHLSIQGNSTGPFTPEEIYAKIQSQNASWTDYVFDDSKNDWIMLLEHPTFAPYLTSYANKTESPETFTETQPPEHAPTAKAWFILKDGNNFGPFSKLELVKMLQSKQLFEYDFVWHDQMSAWQRVSDCEDFKPESIKALKESGLSEVAEVFFRRRHARAKYGCSLIVHNSKAVYKGKSLEISAGGAGVIIENPNFEVGTSLFMHFKPGDGVPPFNALCEIVNKTQLRNIPHGPNTPVKYGVKFTSVSHEIKESLNSYTHVRAA